MLKHADFVTTHDQGQDPIEKTKKNVSVIIFYNCKCNSDTYQNMTLN
jgi:hypothetical protein